jgi:hypothetical protein
MDEFKDIVEVLKRAPNVEPPPDFTGRVACLSLSVLLPVWSRGVPVRSGLLWPDSVM